MLSFSTLILLRHSSDFEDDSLNKNERQRIARIEVWITMLSAHTTDARQFRDTSSTRDQQEFRQMKSFYWSLYYMCAMNVERWSSCYYARSSVYLLSFCVDCAHLLFTAHNHVETTWYKRFAVYAEERGSWSGKQKVPSWEILGSNSMQREYLEVSSRLIISDLTA